MWHKKKVAIIFPTYKERASIRHVISDFSAPQYVDEIIVVDNNAEAGTRQEVGKTRAKLVSEVKQGYGYAIRKGIDSTRADLFIVAEPDGSFDGKDVIKLLAYSDDFDAVFGSRTHVPLIREGSDMTLFKRLGDVLLGKLVTVLFNCAPLTDLGCTLRITNRKAWQMIAPELQTGDGLFATEWVLTAAKNKVKFMEIPVNYKSRIGKSSLSDTFWKRCMWGLRKFFLIWIVWFHMILGRKLYELIPPP